MSQPETLRHSKLHKSNQIKSVFKVNANCSSSVHCLNFSKLSLLYATVSSSDRSATSGDVTKFNLLDCQLPVPLEENRPAHIMLAGNLSCLEWNGPLHHHKGWVGTRKSQFHQNSPHIIKYFYTMGLYSNSYKYNIGAMFCSDILNIKLLIKVFLS